MRRLADQLVAVGRQIAATGDQVHQKAGRIDFDAPVAVRFRDWVSTERSDAQIVVGKLNDLALYLRREAEQLDERARVRGGV